MLSILGTLGEWLHQPEQRRLRREFAVWVQRVLLRRRRANDDEAEPDGSEVQDLEEVQEMLAERISEWEKEWEQRALRILLEQAEQPLVLDDATPNAVIAAYWDSKASEVVTEIAGREGRRILRGSRSTDTPAEILERVHDAARRQQALAALPSYDSLPELASFADGVARTYRSGGTGEALKAIQQTDMDFKHKAVAYGFLLAMDKAAGEQWRYSDQEREFGEHLAGHAEQLLTADGDAYSEALQAMLQATGSTETIR